MAEEDVKDKLKYLVARRGIIKASLTRFDNFVKKCVTPLSCTSRIDLQIRLDTLKNLPLEFEKIQGDIEQLCLTSDLPEINLQEDERNEFETRYYASMAKAKFILEPPAPPLAQPSSITPPNHHVNTYLPPIPLPEFQGSYETWVTYKQTFEALIDKNSNIQNIEKFYYLKGSLKGEAAQIIKSLSATAENYDVAWKLLTERYENKKAITHAHIKAIVELSLVKNESSHALRKLADTFINHYKSLENLGEKVSEWNAILIYLLTSKLDLTSRKEWEKVTKNIQSPTISQFTEFLSDRCKFLESIECKLNSRGNDKRYDQIPKQSFKSNSHSLLAQNKNKCPLCADNHFIYSCTKFHSMSVPDRFSEAKKAFLCTNCLRSSHKSSECKSTHLCKTCQGKHHSLLHRNKVISSTSETSPTHNFNGSASTSQNAILQPNNSTSSQSSCNLHSTNQSPNSFILLSTAVVKTLNKNRQPILTRAVLDSGSQSNFITQELFEKLNLTFEHVDLPISGINLSTTSLTKRVNLEVKSLNGDYTFKMPALVIDRITDLTPQHYINTTHLNIPDNIVLADPNFYDPSEVHILIGAGLFFNILSSGQIRGNKNQPILQQTKLGWIVSGPVPPSAYSLNTTIDSCLLTSSNDQLQSSIENFWKIEENYNLSSSSKYTQEEEECENYFKSTTIRDNTGRFQVSLPTKPQITQLGESYNSAVKRFLSIERKLQRNPLLNKAYNDFMSEYITLGHMSPIGLQTDKSSSIISYYLPHHAVEKQESLTTKTRIVFDASSPTSTGLSLNNVLKIGPTVQSDLFSIILRFRQHNFVLTSDIEKMYRQILIDPEQRNLQRIIWRNTPTETLSTYQLNTVTYGMACSSYLATRCLKEISILVKDDFPIESNILELDTYVDDVVTGASTEEELILIRKNLTSILGSFGFVLRKFVSNSDAILPNLKLENSNAEYIISDSPNNKALGISWNSQADSFNFKSKIKPPSTLVTKRTILSTISSIFDPLGFLGPMIIQVKVLMQKLWILKIAWDDPVPSEIYKTWKHFIDNLSLVNAYNIPRQVVSKNSSNFELHGFSDSSINAYGACIYIRSVSPQGYILSNLLCAKSRVAPLKAISLPRLELCGALVLARLAKKITDLLDFNIQRTYLYTDSTIVLNWLSLEPRILKTFVCNRVSEIQQLSSIVNWYHIRSDSNPADILSRGSTPTDLHNSELWWHGPTFLSQPNETWSTINHISNFTKNLDQDLPEINPKSIILSTQEIKSDIVSLLIERISSYSRLINVTAYCLRFISNLKVAKESRMFGDLTEHEIEKGKILLIKHIQSRNFLEDIQILKKQGQVMPSSKLSSLHVFIDKNDIIRVGGRLRNADLQYYSKHPILLPDKTHFTELIISHEHQRNLHAGAQATLSFVRQNFWPLNGRNAVRKVLHKCIPCFKSSPKTIKNLMGDLPPSRITMSHPFTRSGVDYAGPFLLRESKFRNRRLSKAYICVFVCMATKAVHIELASELTSECFISVLRRFTSRRGLCTDIYSDNGSNFVGANNELLKIHDILTNSNIKNFSQESKINWHFIPPKSPHFGGIWESAVKSIKTHLRRILTDTNPLSYEELYTLLVQIEGVLNSRPLFPLSNDPNDMEALTPGHFLIGHPINMVSDLKLEGSINRLSRYQHLQLMLQHFWSRWKTEYLHTLQQRYKWRFEKDTPNLLGNMVLLKDEHSPVYQWTRGRICELHPGKDGVVRVVSVLTLNGIVKRSVTKVCPLPIEMDTDTL